MREEEILNVWATWALTGVTGKPGGEYWSLQAAESGAVHVSESLLGVQVLLRCRVDGLWFWTVRPDLATEIFRHKSHWNGYTNTHKGCLWRAEVALMAGWHLPGMAEAYMLRSDAGG